MLWLLNLANMFGLLVLLLSRRGVLVLLFLRLRIVRPMSLLKGLALQKGVLPMT
jgi:hypothetical protein